MSVLIKGIDMPRNEETVIVLFVTNKKATFAMNGKYIELEAVEVPTPHGRLIDTNDVKWWRRFIQSHD